VLQERGQGPSSGRFIVGSGRPVHPRFAFGFAGRGPAVHKRGERDAALAPCAEHQSNILIYNNYSTSSVSSSRPGMT